MPHGPLTKRAEINCIAPASFARARAMPGTPPLPPRESIGGVPKERDSLVFSHRAAPLRPPDELA
jgi:hypothetical protein